MPSREGSDFRKDGVNVAFGDCRNAPPTAGSCVP